MHTLHILTQLPTGKGLQFKTLRTILLSELRFSLNIRCNFPRKVCPESKKICSEEHIFFHPNDIKSVTEQEFKTGDEILVLGTEFVERFTVR